ncbi:hypothetical protein SAMN06296386_10641 [Lachnospiraceae bacterium]|nr:hypothetical protein SAMN06296386_10641 [Lachnospiraceae bacterium]
MDIMSMIGTLFSYAFVLSISAMGIFIFGSIAAEELKMFKHSN